MEQQAKRERLLMGLVLLTLCFIWGNSLMPAQLSGRISDWASAVLSRLLHLPVDTEAGHGTVRKLAHGTEYLILGAELTVLLRFWKDRPWSAVLLCGVGAALLDETIQLFVEGRAGQIKDVWIDLGGYCTGILLCRLIRRVRQRRTDRREV